MEIGSKIKDLRVQKGLDTGGAGRPHRAFERIYFPAGARSDLTFHCNAGGYPTVSRYGYCHLFSERDRRADCFFTGGLLRQRRNGQKGADRMDHPKCPEAPDGAYPSDAGAGRFFLSGQSPRGRGVWLCDRGKDHDPSGEKADPGRNGRIILLCSVEEAFDQH